ncbi:MAG: hypothetical protein F4189_16555 [Acidimicrobiaceae bacterium]|nr:hypothetical protein [Acidimicrobiaceae bacterium]
MAPQTLRRSSGWLEDKDEYDPGAASVLPAAAFVALRGMTPWQWPSSEESQHSDLFFVMPGLEDPTLGSTREFRGSLGDVTVVRHSAPLAVPWLRPRLAEFVELRRALGEVAARDMLVEAQRSGSVKDDDTDPIEAAASVAARHPALAEAEEGVRQVLLYIAEQAGRFRELSVDPVQFLDELRLRLIGETTVLDRAMSEILQEPMLTEHEAALALDSTRADTGSVEEYRSSSWLIRLPTDRGYRYPEFQFDRARAGIHDVVRDVNVRLDAAGDPWGVASWWFSRVAYLDGRPADLVGSHDEAEIVVASKALLAPIG